MLQKGTSMKHYFQFIKTSFLHHKKLFFQGIGMMLVLTAFQAGLPLFMRSVVSAVTLEKSAIILAAGVFLYCIFLLFHNLTDILWMRFLDQLGGNILEDVRENLYRALRFGSYEDLMTIGKDKIKHTLYTDTLSIFSSISYFTIQIFTNGFLLLVLFAISFYINLQLTLLLAAAAGIGFCISLASRKPIANASRKVNQKMKEDNQTLNEYVDSIELARTNLLDNYFEKKMKNILWEFIRTSRKSDIPMIFLKNLITEFHQVVSLTIAAFLSMSSQTFAMGDIVFYLCVVDLVLTTSQTIESHIYSLTKQLPSFENIYQLLAIPRTSFEKEIGSILEIQFQNLSFSYKNAEQPVLKEKNFTFHSGDVIRISGANGSGKSTFVKLLTGLLQPTSGTLLLNGIPANEFSPKSINEQILYLSQDERFLNDSLRHYLEAVSGQTVCEDELQSLRAAVHLSDNITSISEGGLTLSGGQRKKILMMRLLFTYKKPSVIILDELEAGLDSESKETLEALKNKVIAERTDAIFFIISHREQTSTDFTQIIEL